MRTLTAGQSVLITGAKGMLGQALGRAFQERGWTVCAPGRDLLDVTLDGRVEETVAAARPGVVVHAAALTDVDACEQEPERAFLVNATGTRNVTLACRRTGVPLVYVSTDYVFGGPAAMGGPPVAGYREADPPCPANVYGASKLAGEAHVRALAPAWAICRTAWLFGPDGPNFVQALVDAARQGRRLRVVDDQRGSPTYTVDVAEAICELVSRPAWGRVYHVVNDGIASRFQLISAALEAAGLAGDLLCPASSGEFPRPAPRPAFSGLRTEALQEAGLGPLRPWRSALTAYLAHWN